MSRILRRPLFRGGPVSSYGTGIASGLADNRRVGLENGGSAWEKFMNWTSRNVPDNKITTGGNILENTWMRDNRKIYGPSSPYGDKPSIEDLVGTGYGMGRNLYNEDPLLSYLYTKGDDPESESGDFDIISKEWVNEDVLKENELKSEYEESGSELPYEDWKVIDAQEKAIAKEQETVEKEKANALTLGGTGGPGILKVDSSPQVVDTNTAKVIEPEESTAISADDVREQAALFDKLLNEDYEKDLKSARISDASDYALKFFESTVGQGKGIKESAGDVAGFALAKPSKTEGVKAGKKKTKQTATVMAINEALASNKSDRELDKMFAKMGLDEAMRKRLLLERVNLETAVARGLSIRQRVNADKSSGTSDMNKLRNHTKGFAEDFEKTNELPTGSVAVTSILTEKKEGSKLPIVADIKSLVVEENKNQIFIDEFSKKVYQVVEDANGNLTLKTLAQ